MSIPLLELKGVGHSFGGLEVLTDVSFTVPQGELIGLIGPNGAGKTTLFNLITGLLPPQRGHLYFEGQEINFKLPHEIAACGIARTFQNLRLFPEMTLEENVVAAMHMHLRYTLWDAILNTQTLRRIEQEARARALDYLKVVDLHLFSDRLAGTLSYGGQRRLEIARALATAPKLLLLDEPVAGMNPRESEDLAECLQQLSKDHGITLLIIEHDMPFVMKLCTSLHVLNFGQIIASGQPNEIQKHPDVIEAYLGSGVRA